MFLHMLERIFLWESGEREAYFLFRYLKWFSHKFGNTTNTNTLFKRWFFLQTRQLWRIYKYTECACSSTGKSNNAKIHFYKLWLISKMLWVKFLHSVNHSGSYEKCDWTASDTQLILIRERHHCHFNTSYILKCYSLLIAVATTRLQYWQWILYIWDIFSSGISMSSCSFSCVPQNDSTSVIYSNFPHERFS